MRKIHSYNSRSKNNIYTYKTNLGGKMIGFRIQGTDRSNKFLGVAMPIKSGAGPHHISSCGHTAQYLPSKQIEDVMNAKKLIEQRQKAASDIDPKTVGELHRRGSSQMILKEINLQKNLNQYFQVQDKEKKLRKLENIHQKIRNLNQASVDVVKQKISIDVPIQ